MRTTKFNIVKLKRKGEFIMTVEQFYREIKGVNDKVVVLVDEKSEKEYAISPGNKYTIGDKLVFQSTEELAPIQDFTLAIEWLANQIRFKPESFLDKNKLLPYNVCIVVNEREFDVTNVDTRADVVRIYGKRELSESEVVELALEQDVLAQATVLKNIDISGLYAFEVIANMYLGLDKSERDIVNTVFAELFDLDFVQISRMVIERSEA